MKNSKDGKTAFDYFHSGVGESAKQREEKYLKRYLVVVIDPDTGNEADFELDCTNCWTGTIAEAAGVPLAQAMTRLKERREALSKKAAKFLEATE